MYLSKVSTALLCLAIGVSDVAASPCKPESSHTLTERSMGATSSVFDAASTSTSIVSAAETTKTRSDNELCSTVSLGSVEVTSATTTNTENALTATEFSETTTTLPLRIKETTYSSTMMEVLESSTARREIDVDP
ncbi:hypothetical protein FCOIX_13120 [Fusarium coicis]|nr:hypothetical protein FCOIX_13120 [Fusarium coicis]